MKLLRPGSISFGRRMCQDWSGGKAMYRSSVVLLGLVLVSACSSIPAIHQAVQAGDSQALNKALKDPGAIQQRHQGRLALHGAVEMGRVDLARQLIQAGTPVDAPLFVEDSRSVAATALILAVSRGDHAMVDALLSAEAQVDAAGWNGMTALMEAARVGRVDLARKLLERGALVNRTDQDGRTALSWAAITGRADVARLLVQKGADQALPDRFQKSPGDYARASNHKSVLKYLNKNPLNSNKVRRRP